MEEGKFNTTVSIKPREAVSSSTTYPSSIPVHGERPRVSRRSISRRVAARGEAKRVRQLLYYLSHHKRSCIRQQTRCRPPPQVANFISRCGRIISLPLSLPLSLSLYLCVCTISLSPTFSPLRAFAVSLPSEKVFRYSDRDTMAAAAAVVVAVAVAVLLSSQSPVSSKIGGRV